MTSIWLANDLPKTHTQKVHDLKWLLRLAHDLNMTWNNLNLTNHTGSKWVFIDWTKEPKSFVSKLEYYPSHWRKCLLPTKAFSWFAQNKHASSNAASFTSLSGRKGKRISRCFNSNAWRGNCSEREFHVYVNVLHKIKNDNCQSWKWRTYFV